MQGAVLGGLMLSPVSAFGWSAPILVVAVTLPVLSIVVWLGIGPPAATGNTLSRDASADSDRGGVMRRSITLIATDAQLCLLFLAQAMSLPVREKHFPLQFLITNNYGGGRQVMECSNLLPTFLSQTFGMSVAQAGQVASVFPIGPLPY